MTIALSEIAEDEQKLLEVNSVTRDFGATKALRDANLTLHSHQICGLLGANGAGKSTLSRIIAGHIAPTSGTLTFRGAPFHIHSARDAIKSGIAMVAQETSLAPDMSVLENIFLPSLSTPGHLSFSKMRHRANEILAELGNVHVLPLDVEVRKLSAAQKQLVEIAKALAVNADLVIFDEPTASLSPSEVNRLFEIMARLRDNGKALVFVSHRLEEVFAITDTVTVLREGITVAKDLVTHDLTQADIIRHMVGSEIGSVFPGSSKKQHKNNQPVVFEVKNIRAEPLVRDVSFWVREGEILGLGGLVGAGRSECAEAIFGLRPRSDGEILLRGQKISPKSPNQAMRCGLGMVAEDRRAQNIVPDFNVGENLMLAQTGKHSGFGRGYGSRTQQIGTLMRRLGLPQDRMKTSLLNFSGGMQQKIIIARWLLIEPDVLILDEPTKGVDIGTRQAIYELLREVAEGGTSIVVISSDFEELLGLCDSITVLSDGYSVAHLPADQVSEESLTLLAAPRSSAEANANILRQLVEDYGGAAFWGLFDDTNFICLSVINAVGPESLQLEAGHIYAPVETQFARALTTPSETYVRDETSGWTTILHRLSNTRGHDLGWIGHSLPRGQKAPNSEDVILKIEELAATRTKENAPHG